VAGKFGQLKDASVAIQYFRVFPSCVYPRTLANSSEFSVLDVGAEVCLCGIDEGCVLAVDWVDAKLDVVSGVLVHLDAGDERATNK
jgi:hypothetical protein